MAITLEPTPDPILESAAARLLSLPASPDDATEGAILYPAVPVYDAPPAGLVHADGDQLPGVIRTGWRFLADEAGALTQVDVTDAGVDADAPLIVAIPGAPANALAAASLQAEAVADADIAWQARILDLPQIGFVALWLHAPDRTDLIRRLDRDEAAFEPLSGVVPELQRSARLLLSEGTIDDES